MLKKQDTLSDEQVENVETILNCGTVLLDTLNSVLNYAKLEKSLTSERTRKQLLVKSVFNFRQFLKDTVQLFSSSAQTKNISIQVENKSLLHQVHSDCVSLRTILSNLLSNAVKFSHENGSIQLEATDVPVDTRINLSLIHI